MFNVNLGDYNLACQDAGLPEMLSDYVKHAALAEQIELATPEGEFCFCAVTRRDEPWPFLVVAQRYQPGGSGFSPCVSLVPETKRLFLGAGERLLCYDLERPSRLWTDQTDCGFWFWRRHGEVVFMGAETEIAGFHLDGRKLWSRFVDPPWEYRVEGESVVITCSYAPGSINLWSGESVE